LVVDEFFACGDAAEAVAAEQTLQDRAQAANAIRIGPDWPELDHEYRSAIWASELAGHRTPR